jgi:hypothetical protein
MDVCYLCGKKFNDDTVKTHGEHIIQQGIGGSLIENNILCSSCGNKLGDEIDIPFNKIFNSISTRLDIKKDRKANSSTNAVNGKFISGKCQFGNELGEIDVVWKDFKVSPVNPFHKYTKENDKVIIYANSKVAKSYKEKVEKEILVKSDENKPEIIICDDLTGIIQYSFEMNSQAFKKGMAKIAIGFSSKHGIPRHDLPLVLNTKSEESAIKDDIPIIQFYPLGVIDNEIEKIKNRMGYFPSHTIIIFTVDTTPKSLVCYIELFSTFQWYVVLNDSFHGESIYEYYSQRILKEDEYKFEPGRRYYKERNIVLGGLGISEERITNAFNKQSKEEGNRKSREQIEYEVIQEEYAKQKYKLDFENHISGVIAHISNIMMLSNKRSVEETINFKRNLYLFYQAHEDDEIFDISSYRRYFIKDGQLNSYCSALIDNYNKLKKNNSFKDYGFKKMAMLEDFIQVEHIKKKI